jgi:pyruvate/2-oxoglutarate dehydrogenase complex dihydrolipoamide dehydrogenase (E3) component
MNYTLLMIAYRSVDAIIIGAGSGGYNAINTIF